MSKVHMKGQFPDVAFIEESKKIQTNSLSRDD